MKSATFLQMTLSTWATLTMATFHQRFPAKGPKCHLLSGQQHGVGAISWLHSTALWCKVPVVSVFFFFFGWLVYNSYTRSVKDSNRLEPRAPQKTKESCRKLLGTARASWSHQLAKHFSEGLVNLLAPVAAFTQMYVWAFFLQTALWCFWYHRLGLFSVAPNVMDLHERFKVQILRYPALVLLVPWWDETWQSHRAWNFARLWSDHLQDGFASLFSTPSGSTLRQMSEVGKW